MDRVPVFCFGKRLSFDTPLPQSFLRLFPRLGSLESGGG
jgi:hypothetical protein